MDGVFIIGTDTGVGKTPIAAGLVKLMHGTRKVCYWKPVQTNTIIADDVAEAKRLTGLPAECFLDSTYRFAEPLSPWMAAKKWGKSIEIEAMARTFEEKRKAGTFVVIEGAGGLLVPFSDEHLQAHFIQRLGLAVIVVGADKVGTINQALLTLNACVDLKIPVLGVVLTRSRGSFGNAESISKFGQTEVIAEFAPSEDVRMVVAQVGANVRLREILGVASLPA